MTGNNHKFRKIMNSGTRLCSYTYIPETRNIVVSEAPDQSYVLKTGDGKRRSITIISKFPLPSSPRRGIIGLGLLVSTIFLEIIFGERPDDFAYVLPGLRLKWPQKHANQGVGIYVIVLLGCSSRFKIFSMRLIFAC